ADSILMGLTPASNCRLCDVASGVALRQGERYRQRGQLMDGQTVTHPALGTLRNQGHWCQGAWRWVSQVWFTPKYLIDVEVLVWPDSGMPLEERLDSAAQTYEMLRRLEWEGRNFVARKIVERFARYFGNFPVPEPDDLARQLRLVRIELRLENGYLIYRSRTPWDRYDFYCHVLEDGSLRQVMRLPRTA